MVAAVFNELKTALAPTLTKSVSSQNILLSMGAISIVAERIIQYNSTHPISDFSYGTAWLCKAVPLVVYGHFFHGNDVYKFSALLMFAMFKLFREGCFTTSSSGMPESLPEAFLAFAMILPKIPIISLTGYLIDRCVRLTEKTGPVMAIVSLSLLALSFFNMRYDLRNLNAQTKVVLEKSNIRKKWVDPVEKVASTAAVLFFSYWLIKEVYWEVCNFRLG